MYKKNNKRHSKIYPNSLGHMKQLDLLLDTEAYENYKFKSKHGCMILSLHSNPLR